MPDDYALLRHSLRGTINALSLGIQALDTGLTREEALEFLDYIEQAADKMSVVLDQYEALPPKPPEAKMQTSAGSNSKNEIRSLSE